MRDTLRDPTSQRPSSLRATIEGAYGTDSPWQPQPSTEIWFISYLWTWRPLILYTRIEIDPGGPQFSLVFINTLIDFPVFCIDV